MKCKIVSLLLTFTFIASVAFCQMVNGRVRAESGAGAANVSVAFKNKANTVNTRADGSFEIMATKLPDTLVFSSVGYEPYKVVVTQKTLKDPNFEIVLLTKRAALEEVVVGYGSSKKKESTGKLTKATFDASKDTDPASMMVTLSGKAYGVTAAAEPAVAVRGIGKSAYNTGVASGRKTSFNDSSIAKGDTIRVRSKLLTAGEVNDFNKWKMWEDFGESDFKIYAQQWQLYLKRRYSVQLQNDYRFPVVGQKVFLVDVITKDTIWQAVTDNTGKAELWAGTTDENDKQTNYIIVTNNSTSIAFPRLFKDGINQMQVKKPCSMSNMVDVAFVVDATGSMGDEIEFLKLELEDAVRNTFEQYPGLNLNMASVFYRDRGDEYVTKKVDFNSDILKVLNFIKLQRSGGGGDYPEAVHSAMNVAIDSLSWSADARTRIMFLVMDAPPHEYAKKEMQKLIRKAAAKGIRIVPVACSGTDKSAEFVMRSMALATNGTYLFLTDDSGVGESHIKPTTDVYTTELLNNAFQRIIKQMIEVSNCDNTVKPKIEPPLDNEVKVYPNPTQGPIRVESKLSIKEIYVADFTGKILQRIIVKNKDKRWDINLSAYPSGTYLIRYITSDNVWGTQKVIVAH
jgi:hypothetical protein